MNPAGAGLERLIRQRHQQRPLDREQLPDGMGSAADAPSVIGGVPRIDHGVELLERPHLGGRDEGLRRTQPICPSTPPFS